MQFLWAHADNKSASWLNKLYAGEWASFLLNALSRSQHSLILDQARHWWTSFCAAISQHNFEQIISFQGNEYLKLSTWAATKHYFPPRKILDGIHFSFTKTSMKLNQKKYFSDVTIYFINIAFYVFYGIYLIFNEGNISFWCVFFRMSLIKKHTDYLFSFYMHSVIVIM